MKKIILLCFVTMIGIMSCSSAHGATDNEGDYYGKNNSEKIKKVTGERKVTVPVSDFVIKIASYLSADIEYANDGKNQVEITDVTGSGDVIDKIVIEEKGATLNIRLKSDVHNIDLKGIRIKVSLPQVNEVTLYASGDFTARELSSSMMSLNILGSGDMIIGGIAAPSIKFLIRGSGDVKVKRAECTNIQFLTQGSGDINVEKVEAVSINTTVQGSGDVCLENILATRAEALVQGSGDVIYKGLDVTSFQAIVQGSGDIMASGQTSTALLDVQGTGDINIKGLKYDRVSRNKQGAGEIY